MGEAQNPLEGYELDVASVRIGPRGLGAPLRSPRSGPEAAPLWRYRVGDWRIVVRIKDEVLRVLVLRIAHRREVYRRPARCRVDVPEFTIWLIRPAQVGGAHCCARPAATVANRSEPPRLMPPTVTCEPPAPSNREVTASTTWLPTVRPKRIIHSRCNGSLFTIVPVAVPSSMRAPDALESVSVSVSLPSSWASSNTGTETVFAVSPAANVSVPLTGV